MQQGFFSAPQAEVNRMDYLSPSKISLLLENPQKFFHKYSLKDLPDAKTKSMKVGDYAHKCLLDPAAWSSLVLEKEFSGKGSLAARQEWLATLPSDALVISAEEKEATLRMVDSIHRDKEAFALLSQMAGKNEVSAYAKRPDGIWLHGRFDRLLDVNAVVEFKTTSSSVDWDSFAWEVFEWDYHLALACYIEMIELITGKKCEQSAWIVTQSTAPYSTRVHYPQEENMLDLGRFDMNRGIERFKDLMKADPSFSKREVWFAGKNPKEEGPCAFPYHILIRRPEWQGFITGDSR